MSRVRDLISGALFLLFIAVATILLVGLLGLAIRPVAHHLDVQHCEGFGQTSGYEVKFQDYGFFTWDCLARTKSGKWVPTDQLRDVEVR